MSENQFLPSGVIFQKAITNKISVFGRSGAPKKISVVKFSNTNEIYTERAQVSKKFYSLITKKKARILSTGVDKKNDSGKRNKTKIDDSVTKLNNGSLFFL